MVGTAIGPLGTTEEYSQKIGREEDRTYCDLVMYLKYGAKKRERQAGISISPRLCHRYEYRRTKA